MSATTKEGYVVIDKNDMAAIADVVRPLVGSSNTMSIGNLKTNLNSAKKNADKTFAAPEENGVSIPILSSYNKKGGNSTWRMLL